MKGEKSAPIAERASNSVVPTGDNHRLSTWEEIPDGRGGRPGNPVLDRKEAQLVMSNSCLFVSSVAIGCVFAGILTTGHELIPILITSGIGMLFVAIWYGASRDYLHAWIFGGIAGFNGTWVLVQLGIWHSWYGIPSDDVPTMMTVYMGAWALLFATPAFAVFRVSPALATILGFAVAGFGLDIASYHAASSSLLVQLVSVPMFLIAATSLACVIGTVFRWQERLRRDPIPR